MATTAYPFGFFLKSRYFWPRRHIDLVVFPARVEGRPLQGLPRMWERVRELAGLPEDVTLHTLRHSFASLAADLGYGDAAIAGLLGHRRAGMTARYTHAADELARETIARSANGTPTDRPSGVALRAASAGVQTDRVKRAGGARGTPADARGAPSTATSSRP